VGEKKKDRTISLAEKKEGYEDKPESEFMKGRKYLFVKRASLLERSRKVGVKRSKRRGKKQSGLARWMEKKTSRRGKDCKP